MKRSVTSKEHEHRIRTAKILPPNFPRNKQIDEVIIREIGKRFKQLLNDLCEGFGLERKELYLILVDFFKIEAEKI